MAGRNSGTWNEEGHSSKPAIAQKRVNSESKMDPSVPKRKKRQGRKKNQAVP